MHPNFQDSSILVPVAELIFLPGHKPRKYYLTNQKVQPGCKPRKYYLVTKPENTTWSPTQKKYNLVPDPESIIRSQILPGLKPESTTNPESTTWFRKYSSKYYLDTNPENIKCSQIQKVLPGLKPRKYTWSLIWKYYQVTNSENYYLVAKKYYLVTKPDNTTWSQTQKITTWSQKILSGHKQENTTWSQTQEITTWSQKIPSGHKTRK